MKSLWERSSHATILKKEKTPKNGPKKATTNSGQRISNLEDKKTDVKNSEGF